MLDKVIIYTDGSCLGNPGPGGYAAILSYKGVRKEFWGGHPDTTNNQMELSGAIRALEQLKRPCSVDLYIDSRYVMDGFEKGWLENWKKNGWKTAKKAPVKNDALWRKLEELCSIHDVAWHYVPGHKGYAENERCDVLAKSAAENARKTGEFFAEYTL